MDSANYERLRTKYDLPDRFLNLMKQMQAIIKDRQVEDFVQFNDDKLRSL